MTRFKTSALSVIHSSSPLLLATVPRPQYHCTNPPIAYLLASSPRPAAARLSRLRATCPDDARSAGNSERHRLRPPLADGTGIIPGEIVPEQRYPPLERVPAPDQGRRRWSLEGAVLPGMLLGASEAQVRGR